MRSFDDGKGIRAVFRQVEELQDILSQALFQAGDFLLVRDYLPVSVMAKMEPKLMLNLRRKVCERDDELKVAYSSKKVMTMYCTLRF